MPAAEDEADAGPEADRVGGGDVRIELQGLIDRPSHTWTSKASLQKSESTGRALRPPLQKIVASIRWPDAY